MDRRTLLLTGLAASAGFATPGCASTGAMQQADGSADYQTGNESAPVYSEAEIVRAGSNFLGVTAEALGGVIERVFSDYGDRPTGYIAGEEGSAALTVGLRYGEGLLYMAGGAQPQKTYWQGPSIGWDVGGNAARVFTLCYGLYHPEAIYRRFPGVEGSAYLVGGLGVNYQNADGIILAPIRAGVGVRLGASVGYLAYSRKRNILPF
ncbi:DUF1134 domain-containing protein [Caulobacter sp. 17J80-11]|uniref:DUF1134 domain-containing protein n=1 Tax=Caulobacter sp. 17J80-11 TaxID=2763502 RepID=UPI001653ABB8|nr:DUF1134 domain-containing protein [Caulobacter sp. 17J80-11]MBC6982938.1 DUF1134 domain-containing protein [Caulobacter sp. 17J80-11]